jgi:hypothetical protein
MMNEIIKNTLAPVLKNGKIHIDSKFKKVKLDVGLSMNAPNSEYWLQRESDLIVFGFEPSTKCHESFSKNNQQMRELYPQYTFIDPNRINETFFPIQCALSDGQPSYEKFFITGNDLGCSSLYEPVYFPVVSTEIVPVINLKNFFELFPWEAIEYIDQLKIDAQGSDYKILVGAGEYLSRIVYITVENTTQDQYKKPDDYFRFDHYLNQFGFILTKAEGINSTYLNTNLIDKLQDINFFTEDK